MDENIFSGIGYVNQAPYPIKKEELVKLHMSYMLARTGAMFKWKGVPEDTIPQRILEGQIQKGYTGIINEKGKYYQVYGTLSSELDHNYMPTKCIVANPYLVTKTFTINKDIVIIPNDNRYMGLYPLCRYYATLLSENVISKNILTINSRAMNVFKVTNERQRQDVIEFIEKLYDGDIDAIVQKEIYSNIDTLPFADSRSHQSITELIEDQQYIKAAWYNDLGLQANYNMKRESINSNEAQLNESALRPFVDIMLESRRKACDKLKEVFGIEWSVDFNSSWKTQRDTEQLELKNLSINMDKNNENEVKENEVKEQKNDDDKKD